MLYIVPADSKRLAGQNNFSLNEKILTTAKTHDKIKRYICSQKSTYTYFILH